MSNGLKITFLVHAIVSFSFGVICYLTPGMWVTMANWTPFDPTMTQLYGAALLALSASSLLAYRASSWAEVRIVVQMEIVYTMLGALISLYAALITGAPAFIWVSVFVFVGFGVAWIVQYRRATTQ